MKPFYWDEDPPEPHQDDALRSQLANSGYVPVTCLLGGEAVLAAVQADADPCEKCPCPKREVCMGRPERRIGLGDMSEHVDPLANREETVLKLARERMIGQIEKDIQDGNLI